MVQAFTHRIMYELRKEILFCFLFSRISTSMFFGGRQKKCTRRESTNCQVVVGVPALNQDAQHVERWALGDILGFGFPLLRIWQHIRKKRVASANCSKTRRFTQPLRFTRILRWVSHFMHTYANLRQYNTNPSEWNNVYSRNIYTRRRSFHHRATEWPPCHRWADRFSHTLGAVRTHRTIQNALNISRIARKRNDVQWCEWILKKKQLGNKIHGNKEQGNGHHIDWIH